jgi:hypothetical protein
LPRAPQCEQIAADRVDICLASENVSAHDSLVITTASQFEIADAVLPHVAGVIAGAGVFPARGGPRQP